MYNSPGLETDWHLLKSIKTCCIENPTPITCIPIPSLRYKDNSVWVLSFLGSYFYNSYIVKMFEIVFFFSVKDNYIFPCLHTIRLFYNKEMLQCFVN